MGPIPFVPVSSLGSSRGRAVYNVRSAFGVICSVFWFERVVAPRPPAASAARRRARATIRKPRRLKIRGYTRGGAPGPGRPPAAPRFEPPRGPRVMFVSGPGARLPRSYAPYARRDRRPPHRRCAPMTSERSRVNEISRVTKYRSPPLSAAAARERGCAHAHMCRPNEPQLPRRVDASARGVRDRWWDF